MILSVDLPFSPFATPRPRLSTQGGFPRAHKTKAHSSYHDGLKLWACSHLKAQIPTPLTGPLMVGVVFFLNRPKTAKREFPSVRPDLSNYVKVIEDALNGVVWVDDGQIVDLFLSKRYDDWERVRLQVWRPPNAVTIPPKGFP